jgi:hypothetical protein
MKWQQKLGNSLGNNSSQKRLPGRAKLLISKQQALGLSNLLNRCRSKTTIEFESNYSHRRSRGFGVNPKVRQTVRELCKNPTFSIHSSYL